MLVTQYRPVAALSLLEDNPRQIVDADFKKLCASITAHPDYFEARPCILSDRTGKMVIIAGNMRYRAAAHLGLKEIPTVLMPGLTVEREREIVVRDNVSNGAWDWDALSSGDWPDAATLNEWGVNVPAEWGVVNLPPAEERDPDLSPPSEPITAMGDLYELNGHRVTCGDSTDAAVWDKLTIKSPSMTFTSPPYGVGENAKLRYHYVPGKEDRKTLYASHKDNPDTWLDLMRDWSAMAVASTDVVLCNVQMLANNKRTMIEWLHEMRGNLVDIAVWDKGHGAPQMQAGVLTNAFEWIVLLSGNDEASRKIPLATFHGTIANIVRVSPHGKNKYADVHGAVYPLELVQWGLELCDQSATVVDPFGGTGTTLIAAEMHRRTACLIELDPSYTDIIVRRWLRYMADNNRPATVKRNGTELTAQQLAEFTATT